MKSTVFFKGSKGTSYIYDFKNKYLLHVHPILELINGLKSANCEDIKEEVMKVYSEINDDEFGFYYNKYLFLKSSGFFAEMDVESLLSGRINSDVIEKHLSDLGQIVFQVTNDCNLKCKYCCFGDLYNGIPVESKEMDFDMVKKAFDYLIPFWNSKKNSSYKNVIGIGFYGGEPLLNFELIQQIVSYCEMLQLDNNASFLYTMTTNATLLPRYIEYLIDHDFHLLISLDGDEVHDSYRVDQSGHATFNRVFENVKFIQKNYPEYFKKRVEFNSILTNRSTVEEIHKFIYSEFSKSPLIDSVSVTDLKDSKIDVFKEMKQEYNESVDLILERGIFSTVGKELSRFFYYNLNNSYRHYSDLLSQDNVLSQRVPTSTCLPFWKKMYISSEGNIMTCEKIAMIHVLGHITMAGVSIDFEEIAEKYNCYFDSLRIQCQNCYQASTCPICIFQTKFVDGLPQCPHAISEENIKFYLGKIISILEEKPDLFFEFNKTKFA